MNKSEKVLVATFCLIICVSSLLVGYLLFPRVEKRPTEKFFYYDRDTNTLTVSGGSEENPMTWRDIQKALRIFNASLVNLTITANTTIVVTP